MNRHITRVLDDHPVMLSTFPADYDIAAEWPESLVEMNQILDEHPTPLYVVLDIRELKPSVDDIITVASLIGRGDRSLYRHPSTRGLCFISNSKPVLMAAAGLKSPVFGGLAVKVFQTLDETLADIDQQVI